MLGGKLYLLGGQSNDDAALSTVEAFDSRTGAWSLVAPMLTRRHLLAAASVGGRLYAIGGHTTESDASSGTVEAFDPQTGTWLAVAPMPTARFGHGAAVLGGKIYVLGGHPLTDAVQVLDPQTRAWRHVAPMATRRYACATAVVGLSGTRMAVSVRKNGRIGKPLVDLLMGRPAGRGLRGARGRGSLHYETLRIH